MSATRVLDRKHTRQKMCESKKIYRSLFGNDPSVIHFIPFHRKHLIGRVRNRLANFLICCFDVKFKVKTMNSYISDSTFLQMFCRNILHCMWFYNECMSRSFDLKNYTLDFLYHGTTTKFLPDIMKEGLLPSKAGQVWPVNREEKNCLTNSMYAASLYAYKASKKFGGDSVILQINVRGLRGPFYMDPEKIDPDQYDPPFAKYTSFSLRETIPQERIMNFYILPEESSFEGILFGILNHGEKQFQAGKGFWY